MITAKMGRRERLAPVEAIYMGTKESLLRCENIPDCLTIATKLELDVKVLQHLKDSNYILSDVPSVLYTVCLKGNLPIVQWIVRTFSSSVTNIPSVRLTNIFCDTCAKGHLPVAQFLWRTFPEIDGLSYNFNAFTSACVNGHLHVAQWLLVTFPDIRAVYLKGVLERVCIHSGRCMVQWFMRTFFYTNYDMWFYESLFYLACTHGKIGLAQWLWNTYLKMDNIYRMENQCVFASICHRGYLHVAQWLMMTVPCICPSDNANVAFRWSCEAGHLRVAQWLVGVFPDIDIYSLYNEVFCQACLNNHSHVVHWLVKTYPRLIDYHTYYLVFSEAVQNGYDDVARLLVQQHPCLVNHPLYVANN